MIARETEYKGIVFKSKSEAQLAYIYDLDNINFNLIRLLNYQYEPHNFITKDGYIPDFLRITVYKDSPFPINYDIIEYKPTMPNKIYLKYLEKQFTEISQKDGYNFIDGYLLYFGSIYNRDISCLMFRKEEMKFGSESFILSWITKEYYDMVSKYRFDL